MENGSESNVSNLFYVLLGFSVWLLLLANFWRQPTPALPAHLVQREQPVAVAAQPTAAPAMVAADADAPETSTGDAASGQQLYASTCSACHGPNGEGVQGLGKDMRHSEFIASLSDEELLAFLKVGRDMSDPLNTTGVAMPPKGGNPALSDEQMIDIIAFMRSIHE